jgi:hypothetical protein
VREEALLDDLDNLISTLASQYDKDEREDWQASATTTNATQDWQGSKTTTYARTRVVKNSGNVLEARLPILLR